MNFLTAFLSIVLIIQARTALGLPTPLARNGKMSTSSIVIFVENRMTGAHPDASVPVNERQQTFAALYGTSITGNAVGVNGELPTNAQIVFGPAAQPHKYTLGQAPTVISSTPVDISKWVIAASNIKH